MSNRKRKVRRKTLEKGGVPQFKGTGEREKKRGGRRQPREEKEGGNLLELLRGESGAWGKRKKDAKEKGWAPVEPQKNRRGRAESKKRETIAKLASTEKKDSWLRVEPMSMLREGEDRAQSNQQGKRGWRKAGGKNHKRR